MVLMMTMGSSLVAGSPRVLSPRYSIVFSAHNLYLAIRWFHKHTFVSFRLRTSRTQIPVTMETLTAVYCLVLLLLLL
jgi:hypothetical protein